jgi:hypothetical protein
MIVKAVDFIGPRNFFGADPERRRYKKMLKITYNER